MSDSILVPPLPHPLIPLAQPAIQRRKQTDIETKWCRISCRATSIS
jgi:hypothetical protein